MGKPYCPTHMEPMVEVCELGYECPIENCNQSRNGVRMTIVAGGQQ